MLLLPRPAKGAIDAAPMASARGGGAPWEMWKGEVCTHAQMFSPSLSYAHGLSNRHMLPSRDTGEQALCMQQQGALHAQ